ncbi:MAG: hypothetical protein VCA36_03240 [Opitutales bacterium]
MKYSVTETIWGGLGRNPNRERNDTPSFPPKIVARPRKGEPFHILFLSKRGMSRAPMAREVLRKLLGEGTLPGTFRISCRGIRPEYDQCAIDQRMREVSSNQNYSLPEFSRCVLDKDLQDAHLILTMGRESEAFMKEYKEKTVGATRPFEHFLPAGNEPYIPDPFLQRSEDYEAHYSKLIAQIEKGCRDLFDSIPFLS